MTRPLRASSTAAVFVLLIAASAHPDAQRARAAQQVAVPEKVTPDDVAKAQKVVEKAAADRNVVLTDPVKREMANEIARQDAATRAAEASTAVPSKKPPASTEPAAPADLPISMEAKVDRLFSKPGLSRAGVAVDMSEYLEVVKSDKSGQVRATLVEDVTQQAAIEKLTLPDDVKLMIVKDLEKQTDGLAASGVAVEVIRAKNADYFKMIAAGFQNGPITQTGYQQIQQQLFQQLVSVHIESTPSGATFSFDDNPIGPTNLDQTFEPGKTYQFQLVLSGYLPVKQPFYVPLGDKNAVFQTVLSAASGASSSSTDPSATTQSKGNSTSGDHNAFPIWWVVVGAVVIVGALVLLVARK